MSGVLAASRRLLWNPILGREVRSRMRRPRAAIVITVFLGFVGAAGLLTYKGSDLNLADPSAPTVTGGRLFAVLFVSVLVLTLLVTPGLCASAISGERERQTLDLLLCTPMGAGRIVVGKLLASLLFVLLLLVATAPLFAIVFFLGGVGVGQVVAALIVCASSALMGGSIGLLCSTLVRRTPAATLGAYLLLFGIVALPGALGFLPGSLGTTRVTGYAPSDCSSALTPQGCPPAAAPGGPTVLVAATSPLTAAVAEVQTVPTSSGSCASQVVPIMSPGGPIYVPASQGCGSLAVGDGDRVLVGSFRGWRVWEVTLIGQAGVVALCLGGAAVALRGIRRLRWRRPATARP